MTPFHLRRRIRRRLKVLRDRMFSRDGWRVVYQGFLRVAKQDRIEVVHATNSVGILFWIRETDEIVLTRQPRKAMIVVGNPEGLFLEVPAGRFDVKLGVVGLVVKEGHEEVGATFDECDVVILNDGEPLALSPGVLTERMYLTVVELRQDQLEAGDRIFGNPGEGERITRLRVSADEFINMIHEDMKTWALAQWFARHRLETKGT